ncbi:MAG: beta-ketoacyl-[acyl-carrier-protein] synthase family protein [Propionibacteriaceae bacterium]|jgi:act minimal PKS ketosynthase (KS/KS alpha)|nr:beta-ketoacyl-[acyl-carrier-protein] synthase family protein [Propionibacteriaceae bacterium]
MNATSQVVRQPLDVAITGLGVVAPGRPGREGFWETIISGRSVVRTITLFDPTGFRSQVAGECDLDLASLGLSLADLRRLDRAAVLALTAAREAMADAALPTGIPRRRVGVVLGSAVGCASSLEREFRLATDDGRRPDIADCAFNRDMWEYVAPVGIAAEVANAVGARGVVRLVSDGCTSGLDAIATGARLVRSGQADVVIAGGADAPVTPIVAASFDAIHATTPANAEPSAASRPFDRDRRGFVLAEGSAMVVLESAERAKQRGAPAYCLVQGAATRMNAFHMTGLREDGAELSAAITAALEEADVAASEVSYVNAHGSGTVKNDRHETSAIKRALGRHAYTVPISSIKSTIGHSLGAIGAIEIAASALAIRRGVVPPTANLDHPDQFCDLDYVPQLARSTHLSRVLSTASGFGGFQSAMVLAEA